MPTKYRVELLDRQVHRELDRVHEPDFSRIAEAILKLEAAWGVPNLLGRF